MIEYAYYSALGLTGFMIDGPFYFGVSHAHACTHCYRRKFVTHAHRKEMFVVARVIQTTAKTKYLPSTYAGSGCRIATNWLLRASRMVFHAKTKRQKKFIQFNHILKTTESPRHPTYTQRATRATRALCLLCVYIVYM